MLAFFGEWYQWVALVLLIVLILFWIQYRKRQM